jgi:L-alanine-DL-glutamate epimerase-like enolase superfamily enzyme
MNRMKSLASDGFGLWIANCGLLRPNPQSEIRNCLPMDVVVEHDAFATERCWHAMVDAVRNAGQPGIAFTAISAVDTALWDLKARLLNVPLCPIVGRRARICAALRQRWLHFV